MYARLPDDRDAVVDMHDHMRSIFTVRFVGEV
jgi:hypothetical protein